MQTTQSYFTHLKRNILHKTDTIDFQHIKDKRGFSVKEYIDYEYNKAIMYPGEFYHCSQNIKNFTSKKSLAIVTNV